MNRLWLTLGVALILCVTVRMAAETKPEVSPFSCVISAETKSPKAGSGVVVDVALTNTSNKPVVTGSEMGTQGTLGDTLHVRHEDGSTAERRGLPQKRTSGEKRPGAFSVVMVEYKPGITSRWKIDITDWYDLTRPGKYFVQMDCEQGVKSNTISVAVTP